MMANANAYKTTLTPNEAGAALIGMYAYYRKYYPSDKRYELALAMACTALNAVKEAGSDGKL